jgi:biopolymer transport protein ExbD
MAEIISRNEKPGRRMHSVKVDLTPMVDLGFLLITFFVFTTTMSEIKALKLVMPKDDGKGTPVAESGTVTIIPGEHRLWYYEGEFPGSKSGIKPIPYTRIDQLRTNLVQLKNKLTGINGNDDKLVVMIKPLKNASFNNIVNMLDEMKICGIKRYALMDVSVGEEELTEHK